ncbi:MAG TPA: GNAT family N-acetyltransferase [Microvirga sp.]|jgi:putative acetyltransferase|nr:GNAT family N-acetyltransferase [Microvirga sp.]
MNTEPDTPEQTTLDPLSPSRSPDLEIRAVRPGDAEDLASLVNGPGYRWDTLRLPYQSPESVRRWLESASPGSTALVAVRDGRVVGSAGLERLAGRRAHAGQIGMGVRDGLTGQGIGTALLCELLMLSDRWLGLRRLELTVNHDNERAIALYERHGFTREGVLRDYVFRDGAFVNALAMARLRH